MHLTIAACQIQDSTAKQFLSKDKKSNYTKTEEGLMLVIIVDYHIRISDKKSKYPTLP